MGFTQGENMKINFMMWMIALSFFTVLGILGTEYYIQHEAIRNGLQQCVVAINADTYEAIWTKECP